MGLAELQCGKRKDKCYYNVEHFSVSKSGTSGITKYGHALQSGVFFITISGR